MILFDCGGFLWFLFCLDDLKRFDCHYKFIFRRRSIDCKIYDHIFINFNFLNSEMVAGKCIIIAYDGSCNKNKKDGKRKVEFLTLIIITSGKTKI